LRGGRGGTDGGRKEWINSGNEWGDRESGEYCRNATVSESTTVNSTEQKLYYFVVSLRIPTSNTTANCDTGPDWLVCSSHKQRNKLLRCSPKCVISCQKDSSAFSLPIGTKFVCIRQSFVSPFCTEFLENLQTVW